MQNNSLEDYRNKLESIIKQDLPDIEIMAHIQNFIFNLPTDSQKYDILIYTADILDNLLNEFGKTDLQILRNTSFSDSNYMEFENKSKEWENFKQLPDHQKRNQIEKSQELLNYFEGVKIRIKKNLSTTKPHFYVKNKKKLDPIFEWINNRLNVKQIPIVETNAHTSKSPKLTFTIENTGVIHLFRQLKKLGVIENTPAEIANFIQSNIKGFENPLPGSIETEFKKSKQPSKEKNLYQIVLTYAKQKFSKTYIPGLSKNVLEIPIE